MATQTINKGIALAEEISKKAYGDTIRYQEIESITREHRGTQRYYQIISKAKKILEQQSKMIAPAGGGDYKILYPGDYVYAYTREVRLANKRIKHGTVILENAPTKDMNQQELQTYNRVNDFHVLLKARMSGNVVEVKKLSERRN